MDDLNDDLDDLDDDLESELEGDVLDDDLSGDELGEDYAISDQNVRALSGERGAALMRPTVLGSAVPLEDGGSSLEKLLRGGAEVTRITVHFANGRKLHIKP